MDKFQISRLREIPLEKVLLAMKAQPDPNDPKNNWKTPVGRITVTDQQFYNHDQAEGGSGAIDLTMHVGGFRFSEALAWLAKEIGTDAAIEQYQVEAVKHATRIIERTPTPKQEIPTPDASKLSRVRAYLTDTRAIPAAFVDKAIASRRLWADKDGNAVFALHDASLTGKVVGAELRGTQNKPFHSVRGEQKGMFFAGTSKADKAVFVESALDAISYDVLHPKSALIVSTAGANTKNLLQAATILRERGYQLVSGFNNDKDGNRITEMLASLGEVQREKPSSGKDWNMQLQLQRDKRREQPQYPKKVDNKEHDR